MSLMEMLGRTLLPRVRSHNTLEPYEHRRQRLIGWVTPIIIHSLVLSRSTPMRLASLLALLFVTTLAVGADAPMPRVVLDVDGQMERHWREASIRPSSVANGPELFRRLLLDLTGRVPTAREADTFQLNQYAATVRQLLAGPEFEWYFATVLDEIIQGRHAGNDAFVGYLRKALHDGKGWDIVFREVMLGPWDTDARKPAVGFLDKRAKDLDVLTVDVARSFFGVDISCARCHDHPLVPDWKRDHYYGMAAFLVRTTGGKGSITEKPDGEAKFAGKDGKERVAPMMFLTSKVTEPEAQAKGKTNRREALVQIAFNEQKFFSRSFVNRLWDYFFGQGLVNPVDQMHTGNVASVPALLDRIAEDFAVTGYDIRKLVSAIVSSRTYRLDNHWTDGKLPAAGHFAVTRLRPLSQRQLARSLVIVLGDGTFDGSPAHLTALDKQTTELLPALDPRTNDFQSSAREALFVSNGEAMRKLLTTGDQNLIARLAATNDDRDLLKTAIRTVFARPATASELGELESWLKRHGGKRQEMCEDLVWSLVASAEFRFNH